jgi:predicted transcriptional regulator
VSDIAFSVRVDRELLKLVRSVAHARDETISQVVRRAFRQYVAHAPAQTDLVEAVRRVEAVAPVRKGGRS